MASQTRQGSPLGPWAAARLGALVLSYLLFGDVGRRRWPFGRGGR